MMSRGYVIFCRRMAGKASLTNDKKVRKYCAQGKFNKANRRIEKLYKKMLRKRVPRI